MLQEVSDFQHNFQRYGFRAPLPQFKSDTPETRLYNAIVAGRVKDDMDAIEFLYKSVNPENSIEYFKLLSRLRIRLLNGSLFLHLRKKINSPVTIVFASLWRRLATVKILERLGDYRNAIFEARRGLKRAQEYGLTQLAIEFAQVLLYHYHNIGNITKYQKFELLITELRTLYSAELAAGEALKRFEIHYKRRISYKKGSEEILDRSLQVVEEIRTRFDSVPISVPYYLQAENFQIRYAGPLR